MRISTRVAGLAVANVLGLITLTGCSSSSETTATSSTDASAPTSASSSAASTPPTDSGSASTTAIAAAAVITIKGFKFGGATRVPAGAKITVTNHDREAHTVTSDAAGAFDVKIDPGRSATFSAPAKAGTFPYHCAYHGNMHGTLKVS